MRASTFPLRASLLATSLALGALSGTIARAQSVEPRPADAPQGVPANAGSLGTITIEANADASAEGLPKPFAGGQVARGSRIGILGNQDLMDTPFSTTSYTGELIRDQQARSIGDVLLNDPSIRAARGFGNFQQAYFIRGFPVYSDDVAYNGLYGLVPRQYMATEFVERVEVFRGANAFLSGAGAGSVAGGGVGGLINVVPKRAPAEPLSQVTLGTQTGGEAYVAADLARRFGPDQSTGVRINLARRDGGTAVDDEKQRLSAAALGLDWRSRSVRLSADLGYQAHDLRAPRPSVTPAADGLPLPRVPDADRNFAQPWTFSDSRDVFGTVRGEIDLSESVTAWGAFGMREGKENNSLANPTLTDAFGGTSSYRFDNVRRNRVRTGEVGLRARATTGPVGHTITVSASNFDAAERNAYGFSSFAGFAGNIYRPFGVLPPAADFFTGGTLAHPHVVERIRTSSLAVADTMSFAQDRVLLTIGARHQRIDDSNFNYDSGLRESRYDEARTTPVAGLVVKASERVSIYANYIEGLVKGDTASGANIVNAGQIFAPYVSKQKELGVKYDGGHIGAGLAVFSTGKPSAFVQNNVYGVYGEQRNRGVELSFFGAPMQGLRVLGGLTLLDAEQRRTAGGASDGNDAIGVPRRQANLGAEWDVPGVRGLALNARLIHTGRQYADGANLQAVPAWTRLDLGARYLMDLGSGRVLTLRGRIDNLTNKSYWASAGGYPGSGYLVVGAPRTFVLTGTVDF